MTETSTAQSGGIGFTGLLTLLFVAFKLLGIISWSWWWVLSPLWIPVALVLAIVLVVFIVVLIVAVCTK